MREILVLLVVALGCNQKPEGTVTARLRISQCIDKENGQSSLLVATIFENKTDKNIYMIKSDPYGSQLSIKEHKDTLDDMGQELAHLPKHDFNCLSSVVTPLNYLETVIEPFIKKKKVMDSLVSVNRTEIEKNYDNSAKKFKTQMLVLNKGETLEIDNILIPKSLQGVAKLKFNRPDKEFEKRVKLGETLIIPHKIGDYFFWDGNVSLSSEEIEVISTRL